jgi:hypothetical protein
MSLLRNENFIDSETETEDFGAAVVFLTRVAPREFFAHQRAWFNASGEPSDLLRRVESHRHETSAPLHGHQGEPWRPLHDSVLVRWPSAPCARACHALRRAARGSASATAVSGPTMTAEKAGRVSTTTKRRT